MGGQRLIVCALAALLPLVASAEEQGGSGACRADVQKYCASASNKKECMLDHQNDVSEACYSFMKSMVQRERSGKGTEACRVDAQKYCANEKDKKECLIDHQNDISDGCYDVLKKALKQGSAPVSDTPFTATAYSSPIYKVKTADGRIVYTNAAVQNGSEVKDRNNISLPIR